MVCPQNEFFGGSVNGLFEEMSLNILDKEMAFLLYEIYGVSSIDSAG